MLLLPYLSRHWPAWSPEKSETLKMPCYTEARPHKETSGVRSQVSNPNIQVLPGQSPDMCVNELSDDSDDTSLSRWVTPRDVPGLWDSIEAPDLVEKTQAILSVSFVNSWFMESVRVINWSLFYASKFGVVSYVTIIIGTVINCERYIVSVRNRLLLKLIKVGTTCWINVYWFFSFISNEDSLTENFFY